MEEYRPVAADGAAPEGQTRLPWGDEAPLVAVEAHPPAAVEAHPPEPITHFASPEATFFTAEPPARAFPDAEVPAEKAPAEPDDEADEPAFEEPAADEPPDEVWGEETVDDVWSDDEVWTETTSDDEEPPPLDEPLITEVDEVVADDVLAVDEGPVADEVPARPAPPDAPDEIQAMLDQLLPTLDESASLDEAMPPAADPSPWAAPVAIEEPPAVDEPSGASEEPPEEDEIPVVGAAAAVDEEAPVVVEDEVEEEPVVAAEAPIVVEDEAVEDKEVEEEPAEPPTSSSWTPTVVADAPRMVSPSHPEWVEQERIVVDEAAPELEWADPETTDFGPPVDASTEPSSPVASPPLAAESAEGAAPAPDGTDWFNPPDLAQEPAAEAPAAEWLTLPELDEQLAAVSESPPPADELPPMVPAASDAPAPLPPIVEAEPPIEPAAFVAPVVEAAPPAPADEPTLLEPVVPFAPAAVIPELQTPGVAEPVAVAALSERGRSMRRIVMVAAALVMGTVVVRQLNAGGFSTAVPTFVGVTSGEASRSKHAPVDQPATGGADGSQQIAAGADTSTTVAGKATTGSTTVTSVAGAAGTATTAAGGKTTATTAATATTAPLRAPAPAPSSTPGYGAAHFACQKFNNAYAARDNGGMTDDQADDVFVNTASQAYGANQVNPQRWGALYNHALTLQKQLEGTVDSTDDQIEAQIALVYNDCKAAA